jgi:hypothetical protein
LKLSAQEQKNLAIATRELKDMLQYNHLEVADEVMADSDILHNPNVPNGREGCEVLRLAAEPDAGADQAGVEESTDPDHYERLYVFFVWDRKAPDPAESVEGIYLGPFRSGPGGERQDTEALERGKEECAESARAPGCCETGKQTGETACPTCLAKLTINSP